MEGGRSVLRFGGAFLLGLLLAGDFFVGEDIAALFLAVVFGGDFAAFPIAFVVVRDAAAALVTAIGVTPIVGVPATTAFAQSRKVRFANASVSGSYTPHNTWTGLRHF